MKKIIWSLLILLGIVIAISGCARWTDEPEEPGEAKYQLVVTVEVKGRINSSKGIYYIVMDTDGDSAGPGYDISLWEKRFYYIKLEDGFFYFAQNEEGSSEIKLTSNSIGEKKFQVTIALSDLEDPNSIDINVITADSDNNTYDHLDGYFTISTYWGFSKTINDSEGDSGDGGVDFDIVKVTAEITTLY